jgi:hypothetical protein
MSAKRTVQFVEPNVVVTSTKDGEKFLCVLKFCSTATQNSMTNQELITLFRFFEGFLGVFGHRF